MSFGNKVSPILTKHLMKTKSLGFIVLPLMNLLSLSNTFIVFNYFQLSFSIAIFFLGVLVQVCQMLYIYIFLTFDKKRKEKENYILILGRVVIASMHPSQCDKCI